MKPKKGRCFINVAGLGSSALCAVIGAPLVNIGEWHPLVFGVVAFWVFWQIEKDGCSLGK